MKIILSKTFTRMFKVIPFSIIVIISAILGGVFAKIYNGMLEGMKTYERLSNNVMTTYSIIAFILIAGLMIWVIVANSSSGLFASEIHEGTMRLLLAKAINRVQLIAGKILGMLLGSIVYLIISFSVFLLTFCLFSSIEKEILCLIIKATLTFIIYGAVVIFILGGIGTFLSTIFKKKVPAIIILIALGGLIFGIFPIIRVILNNFGYYDKLHLYLFDINYHFGLIFYNFLHLVGDFASSQSQSSMFTLFTNLYSQAPIDLDLTITPSTYYVVNTSLNSVVIMITYLISSIMLYLISFKIMIKKDI